jgi:hypothetical protein
MAYLQRSEYKILPYLHFNQRRRNVIDFLKMPSGAWTLDCPEIGNCFTSHFKTIFSSSTPIQDEDLLSLFDNCIFDEQNAAIYAIRLEPGVFSALSSIGSTKAPGLDGFTTLL